MKLIKYTFLFLIVVACVEEIDVIEDSNNFENLLVVEATITNQLIKQEIRLSRAYELNSEGPIAESNAEVKILDNNGQEYIFQETELGMYQSANSFAAQPNIEYTLVINTQEGKTYQSLAVKLTQETQLDEIYAERGFNENGEEGMSIFVDSFDPTSSSHYYRYDYEETYKVIAPYYSPFELVIISRNPPFELDLQLKDEQQQVCYATDQSKEIVITNTNALSEDRVSGFRVRFLHKNNRIISHRYSILVTQYVQSREAYSFYETLKSISSTENILSETQPGFIIGNISSKTNTNDKVFGFFEVSSSSSKRLYFNYADEFPGEELPFLSCPFTAPVISTLGSPPSSPIINHLDNGFKYFGVNDGQIEDAGPYLLVSPICGDCTFLGDNTPPIWWEE